MLSNIIINTCISRSLMLSGDRPSTQAQLPRHGSALFFACEICRSKLCKLIPAISGCAIWCFLNIFPWENILSNIVRIKRTRFAFCEQQAKLAVSSAMCNRKLLLVCAIIAQNNLRLRRISMLSIACAVDISRLTNYSLWECRWALMPFLHDQWTARGRLPSLLFKFENNS